MFAPARLIDALERTLAILPPLVRAIPQDDAAWIPDGGGWSVKAIVAHLADEEVEDFRTRLASTLSDPSQPWPGIAPEKWAVEREYESGDTDTFLDRWISERRHTIAWLRSLADPAWDNAYQHPSAGPLTAGDLLTSWAAHDALHIRQIGKRLYQLAARDGAPCRPLYAGPLSG